jgi:Rps23 Pro-64 3,4-dihydroxylase Tpa1-like proline 4-hydroxylase
LIFDIKPKYPDEAPLCCIEEENFEKDIKEKLTQNIQQTIEENLGMEMIFSIVGNSQEMLNTLFDEVKKDRELQKELKEKAAEELERKKFEGTRVSVESFMKWRKDFENEMGITEKRVKENEANRKLTGRELFLRDQTLLDSDILFLQSQGDSIENVKIDESLFQNLDLEEDLPSDSDDDDPDWKPS